MKQKDIIVLMVVVFISLIFSYFVSGLLFPNSTSTDKAPVVPVITDNFPTPSSQYFNSSSYDPTQLIQINPNTGALNFSASSQ